MKFEADQTQLRQTLGQSERKNICVGSVSYKGILKIFQLPV